MPGETNRWPSRARAAADEAAWELIHGPLRPVAVGVHCAACGWDVPRGLRAQRCPRCGSHSFISYSARPQKVVAPIQMERA